VENQNKSEEPEENRIQPEANVNKVANMFVGSVKAARSTELQPQKNITLICKALPNSIVQPPTPSPPITTHFPTISTVFQLPSASVSK